ncbi:MAG: amidohydrolase family protein [Gemmatimonadales bacterium]
MKRIIVRVFAVVAAGTAVLAASRWDRETVIDSALQEGTVTVFENVTVIPMDRERVLPDQTVVVAGERIVDMGPTASVRIPGGARTIDGSEKYLMPGLAEMHGHTPVPQGNPNTAFVKNMMFLYVANGVTTVRGMLGAPGQLELRRMVASGEILGPTLYLAGPSFNGNSIDSPEQAVKRVRQQHDAGWDLLKVHPGLTRSEYDAMAITASQVGMRFGGHVPSDVGLIHAIKMGQQTFDHLDGFLQYAGGTDGPIDERKLGQAIRMARDAGAAVVPTMVLWEVGVIGLGDVAELVKHPELRYWPQSQIDAWTARLRRRQSSPDFDTENALVFARNRRRTLKALSDAGLTILMGTDSPQIFSVPGFSLHREMRAMASAGMTPYQILESGTKNVGSYFQGKDSFGTVAVGRRADLILSNSNPLDDVANVADRAGVMVRGRWLPRSLIRQRLSEIAAAYEN